MSQHTMEKTAGVAAVAGAIASLAATVAEPDWGGDDATEAARIVAGTRLWDADRLLDLVGLVLTVAALTVVNRRLIRAGSEWPRLAQPMLVLVGAFGGVAIATGAAIHTMATSWQDAGPEQAAAYLASFDGVRRITEDVFFAAFLALGLYLALLSGAILTTSTFARWLGWCAGAAGVLILAGDLLSILFDAAFLLVLAGYVAYKAMLVGLGVSLWRAAAPQIQPAGAHPV